MDELIASLSWNEQERIEKLCGGKAFASLFADFNNFSAAAGRAIEFVVAQRTNPEITIKEVGDNPGAFLRMNEVMNKDAGPQDGDGGGNELPV